MKLEEKQFKWLLAGWILLGHVIVQLTGVIHYEFDSGIYWLPNYAFQDNFLLNIFHLHTNPPLLNIIAGICYKLNISFYVFYMITFCAMQLWGGILFHNLLLRQKIKYPKIFTILTIGNPLHFIWFSFYYYPAIIFFLSIVSLSILFSDRSDLNKFLLLCLVFTFLCMLRASYHPLWVLFLLLSFGKRISLRKMLPGLMLLLLPILWYSKNLAVFGFWGGSSLFGQNISAHYPDHLRKEVSNFNSRGRYKLPLEYAGLYNENSSLIKRFEGDQLLNDPLTLHNVRTIPISDGYKKETIENFELGYSIKTIIYGTFSYFSSPAIDEYNNKSEKAFFWNNSFLIDWFDLPNIKLKASNGGYSFIRLSFYTIIYPLVLLLYLSKYRSLNFEIKFIINWILITTLIYCTIDPNEAARMRYETEPIFYFLTITLLNGRSIKI